MAKEPDSPSPKPGRQVGKNKSDVDVSDDLDARPEDVDKVKGGGRKRYEDPCQGGEKPRP